MDVEQAIRQYLPNVLHMSLATCADNRPWVCEVHFVYDDDLNLYFHSKLARRHSMEIAQNPNVAGSIVEQHPLDMKPRGLYFEGTVSVYEAIHENGPIYNLFRERLGLSPDILREQLKTAESKFYKITVSDWYVFDARESSPSQKYHLER